MHRDELRQPPASGLTQTGFTAKVVGALDSLINGSVVDSVIKGTLTTVGPQGRG